MVYRPAIRIDPGRVDAEPGCAEIAADGPHPPGRVPHPHAAVEAQHRILPRPDQDMDIAVAFQKFGDKKPTNKPSRPGNQVSHSLTLS
ncbi:hypothetical protein Ntsu_09260 [Nocardia sp. IFM 10818]